MPFARSPRMRARLVPLSTTASMGFKCGIVGLPNGSRQVDALFNALTQTAAAQAAIYPLLHHPDPMSATCCGTGPASGDSWRPLASAPRRLSRPGCHSLTLPWAHLWRFKRAKGWKPVSRQYSRGATRSRMSSCVASRTAMSPMLKAASDPLSDISTIETELMLADLKKASSGGASLQMEKRPRAAIRRPRNC